MEEFLDNDIDESIITYYLIDYIKEILNAFISLKVLMFEIYPAKEEIQRFFDILNFCLDKNLILQQDEEVMASTVDSGTSSDSSGESQRTSKKNSAYKELYRQLSLKSKIISQYRRFEKACYKMVEGLDY